MILAVGDFDTGAIMRAAASMAAGVTADHEGTFTEHPHGWGAIWRDLQVPGGLAVFRDEQPVVGSAVNSPIARIRTSFLAVHVRRAGSLDTIGPEFTHPLQRAADDWLFMHNGSLPSVYRLLGLSRSRFDTAEYFDYLIPPGTRHLDRTAVLGRLAALPEPRGNAANAIAACAERAYLIHWRMPGDGWPRYFTMQEVRTSTARIISSEIVPELAPVDRWRPIAPHTLLEFVF